MAEPLYISVPSPAAQRHHSEALSGEAPGLQQKRPAMMVPIHGRTTFLSRKKELPYSAEATFREQLGEDGKVRLVCSQVTLTGYTWQEKMNYAQALRFLLDMCLENEIQQRHAVTVVYVGPEPGDFTFEFMPVNLDWKAEQYVDAVRKGRDWKGKAIMTRSIRDVYYPGGEALQYPATIRIRMSKKK